MDIKNHSAISFKANVSPFVMCQIQKQLKNCESKKKCSALVKSQLNNIKNWGSPDSTIIVTKDFFGHFRLGVECFVKPDLKFSWAIKNLKGKTELSQFIALKKSDIEQTEESIKYLYNKYHEKIFEKYTL